MDYFFYQGEPREAASSWFDEIIPAKSDFVPYFEQAFKKNNAIQSGRKNVKMRMVGMLRKMAEARGRVVRNEKSTRHMLRERLRRQSQKEGYAALHALLPTGTKCDKISIITTAAFEIIRTRRVLEDLRKRNKELKKKLASQGSDRVNQEECRSRSNVNVRVGHPVSGIVSLVEVLHCVKDTGMDITGDSEHSWAIKNSQQKLKWILR